ncbi:Mannose-1-phosphate guanylyltransferase (GDP) [Bathymodiolus heckerae thiotrophic gill symbiont]|uniref:mannose-1-phosphate guanylyltransferase/mannose-6-phosphate isomerase n=1 Tax=Bathymodiolus heckerae thiotrophic gill symbiont TaxID=1052212 RepID=UPI0010B90152|nr:mannose-1-phosphate guanylyltransferase/mannose-6-phosphate isomerase [Bathymodiolus heckerae thiotrophic gill symbiont]SHN91166.1 Mannose-1-phosphate guanylyltransferase (GDP) [Bathymodiolus heckerae thiotrophic gill symbiont]
MQIIPVILSSGSGTRLWPLSRKQYPKQYLPLVGDNTMLQETILRLSGLNNLADPIIVCNADHRFLVAEQCQQIDIKNPTILLEPVGRNTAPAIAAAALQSLKNSDDAVLLVLSADHVIQDIDAFHQAINIACQQAQEGRLATFGIVPTDANTGYGYIKSTKESINGAYKVKEFVEKPDLKTAESYLEQGNYLWNSGMFMFKATMLIDELTTHSPEIVTSINNAVNNAEQDLDFIRLDKQAFESSPSDSIDYALMEKSDNVVVISLDAQWNDIGSWSALHDIGIKDSNGNVIQGDVFTEDTTNTYIHANHHMVATIGVQDLVIVDTPNATLISTKDKSQEVKNIVEQLQRQDREEQSCHRKVYRPWGWYDSIEMGRHFQVKRLHVNSGTKLSLQMYHKRAEHWVVVSGTATAINGGEVLTLTEGDSTYIPIGVTHGLENKTNEQLEIIEVQSGTYLGEDDIVRFEDIYGRVKD